MELGTKCSATHSNNIDDDYNNKENNSSSDSDNDNDKNDIAIDPSRWLHIGDDYEKDYLGAKNAGMNAFLLQRSTNSNDNNNNKKKKNESELNIDDDDVVISLMDVIKKMEQRKML